MNRQKKSRVKSRPLGGTKHSRDRTNIKVVDLFCGIGGLSHGFLKEGLQVIAGIDSDSTCKYGYEYNNRAEFICKDIFDVTAGDVKRLFGSEEGQVRVLAGCAPCQPFSRLNIGKARKQKVQPLERFAQLIEETLPDVVSMENVAGLADMNRYPIFKTFVDTLERCGYEFEYQIVNAADYGVPQNRYRLVLLASRLGEIRLIGKTHSSRKRTVKDAIGALPKIKHGETCPTDALHRARKLDPINLARVKATRKNGGNSKNWKRSLKLKCHLEESGMTYRHSVYGRMKWEEPAPTMTTQCVGLGNGRFGHPSQNRAISLREAALLQTFPKGYRFVQPGKPVFTNHVARFIGNAVPVRLGKIIARTIKKHVGCYGQKSPIQI